MSLEVTAYMLTSSFSDIITSLGHMHVSLNFLWDDANLLDKWKYISHKFKKSPKFSKLTHILKVVLKFLYKMEKPWVLVGQTPEIQRSAFFWLALYAENQPQCRTYCKSELLHSLKRNYFQVIFENVWGLKKKWHKFLCHFRYCSQNLHICSPVGLASNFRSNLSSLFVKASSRKYSAEYFGTQSR